MDPLIIYRIIYALAARDGREAALFGMSAREAEEAFQKSLAGKRFPELWFEVPLSGDPWFDLHVLTACDDLSPADEFLPETTGGNPAAFKWFAAQERGVRQLALSWDVGSGDASSPAVQLLVDTGDPEVICGFLSAAGRTDAASAYRAFHDRLPQGWFACYTGVFPERPGHNLRVECIPNAKLQQAYADDKAFLAEHLHQLGMENVAPDLLSRCQLLANTPFQLEFQFDVETDGSAGRTFGASVRFASPPGADGWAAFDPDGAAGVLMAQVEDWGLVDGRWRLLADTAFAKRAKHNGDSELIYCFPAFLKLRWRDGKPLDAKAYLMAGMQ